MKPFYLNENVDMQLALIVVVLYSWLPLAIYTHTVTVECVRPISRPTCLCGWVSAAPPDTANKIGTDCGRTAEALCSDCSLTLCVVPPGRTGDCDRDSADDEKTGYCEWLVSSDEARDDRWSRQADVDCGLHRSWCSCTIARRSSSEHTTPPASHPVTNRSLN